MYRLISNQTLCNGMLQKEFNPWGLNRNIDIKQIALLFQLGRLSKKHQQKLDSYRSTVIIICHVPMTNTSWIKNWSICLYSLHRMSNVAANGNVTYGFNKMDTVSLTRFLFSTRYITYACIVNQYLHYRHVCTNRNKRWWKYTNVNYIRVPFNIK